MTTTGNAGTVSSHVPRRSRWVRGIPFGVALVIIVAGAVFGVDLLRARSAMLRGVSELQAAQQQLQAAQTGGHFRRALHQTSPALRQAHADFGSASARLSSLTFLTSRLGWVPRYGDQIAAAPSLAAAGRDTTSGLLAMLDGLKPVTDRLTGGKQLSAPALVKGIATGKPQFRQSCLDFGRAWREREAVGPASSPILVSALHTLDQRLPALRVICRGLMIMPSMLGYPAAKTYLVAYQDPQELRATGGFIGSAGLMTLDHGRASQHFHNTGFHHENYTVPSPEPMRLYNTEPFWLFRDSNWSPDFPTTAALERFFARLDLHRDVQGVIDITPAAAADVLTATGPMYVPQYGQTVTSGNIAYLADYYAHWSPVPGPNPDESGKQFIEIVADRLFSRLEAMPPTTWLRLGQSIADAVAHRDILVNFTDPQAQALVSAAGASGRVNPTSGDYLYVVDSNLSYNKINPYVHESVRYQATIGADRWVHATLTLRYTNRAPERLKSHGIGPGAGTLGGPLDYADFVRILVPNGGQIAQQSGWSQVWEPGTAYGKMMFCGYLIVPHNQTRSVTVQYNVPPNVFSTTGGRRYRLLVQRQPGRELDSMSVWVQGTGVKAFSRMVKDPQSDLMYSVPVTKLPFSPIPLPPAAPEVVAPGHWIEPHAFLSAPK